MNKIILLVGVILGAIEIGKCYPKKNAIPADDEEETEKHKVVFKCHGRRYEPKPKR